MGNEIRILRQGESLPFVFDRSGESIEGWVCTINVKVFADDTALISRVIAPVDRTWPGFLTSAETGALNVGIYRLTGVLTNSTTDEEEQIPIRFNITDTWA